MIYLVSSRIDVTGVDDIRKMSVQDSINMIRTWPVVQYDSETTGLDARICKMQSMQFGYKNPDTKQADQIVVDCLDVDPASYKDVIEKSYLIGHNLKFDIKFLYNHGIIPRRVYDTMICEQVLYLGYSPKQVTFNLHDVLLRRCGINVDKSYQSEIAYRGLTLEGIRYAAKDVEHLQDIRYAQIKVAKSRDSLKALSLENRFVPVIAYLEWCGIKLDSEKWTKKFMRDKADMEKYESQLNEYVLSHPELSEFVSAPKEGFDSLFTLDRACAVKWSSPMQVVPVFKKLGFNVEVANKLTGKKKESALMNNLLLQKGIADDFLDIYRKFQENRKRYTTYGQGHLYQINPNTGRIHTEFRQLGTKTGRMACGSSKKENADLAKLNKVSPSLVTYCNLQNLPHDEETRACFIAEPGNVFVSCDYSAEESRVQADVWNEPQLLDSFANGIDTHNMYAKLCFPEELKDIDVRDVKKMRPDLRDLAKKAEFAVGYGSDGSAIAKNLGMPIEDAKAMVSGILNGMTGMAAFKKKTAKFLRSHGWMTIHPKTGHRIYWPAWTRWKALVDTFDGNFWNDYAAFHKGTGDRIDNNVKWYKKQKAEWLERKVLNVPIQGGSAIVMKQAAIDLFKYVVDNGLFGKVLFCVFVHDELDCECPEELADTFPKEMERIMEKAAAKYYDKLPIPATCEVQKYWKH